MSKYSQYLENSLSRINSTLDDSGTRPILFMGSGLSRRYINAPDWENLLSKLIELNPNMELPIGYYTQQTDNDYPQIASILIEKYQKYAWEKKNDGVFPEELYNSKFDKNIFLKYQIASILNNLDKDFTSLGHEHEDELRALSKLNPHAIITTNYDRLLDKLFPTFKVIVGQQVIKQKNATSIGHILKIHGSTETIEEIVISQDDYENFNQKKKYLSAKLLTYFMEHPIFFIGYSITDENIKNILSDISEIVSENSEQIVENIWLIEWKKDEIKPEFVPPIDKSIDLGNGKTLRINYILVNSFFEIFSALYQPSLVELSELRELQDNVYNIVKSKTISNLEVDMVSIQDVNSIQKIEEFIGINSKIDDNNHHSNLLSYATITDPEQFIARFPLNLSDVAEKLGYSQWYSANELIKQVAKEKDVDLKLTNNNYHVDMGDTGQHVRRYSKDMVDLLKLVRDGKDYNLNFK